MLWPKTFTYLARDNMLPFTFSIRLIVAYIFMSVYCTCNTKQRVDFIFQISPGERLTAIFTDQIWGVGVGPAR